MKKQDLAFMQQIRECFLSRQANQFLVTGNVNDIYYCPWLKEENKRVEKDYLPLIEYLTHRLATKRRLVISYNIAKGIQFPYPEDKKTALDLYLNLFKPEEQELGKNNFEEILFKSPSSYIYPSLVFIKKLCEASSKLDDEGYAIAVIIEHIDSIIPNANIAQMNDADRQRLIFFKEWMTDTDFLDSDHLLFLISETASGINESIYSLPQLVNVNVPLPDHDNRKRFIRKCVQDNKGLKLKESQATFAEISAGMTLFGIEQTIRLALYQNSELSKEDFLSYLNQLLVNQIGDYIEVVHPQHSLKDVVGNTALKKQLQRLTKALNCGVAEVAPVGILFTGPNGVGKTYIAMAWAGDCKRIVLVLKNLRSSFFGETDQIFEKIRNVLEVLGNVIILVDEADTVFAKPGENVHETEQRLFGNVIKMMGNPANRSKILWVLMTARPDNMAPDMKRSGRCGTHLPVFDPEGDDRIDFVNFVLAECEYSLEKFSEKDKNSFMEATAEYSPADFRELISELKLEKILNKGKLSSNIILKTVKDHIPGNIGPQRKEQITQALKHCSHKSLIPVSMARSEQ